MNDSCMFGVFAVGLVCCFSCMIAFLILASWSYLETSGGCSWAWLTGAMLDAGGLIYLVVGFLTAHRKYQK